MDYVNKFAKRLVELREKKGLSQQQLADKLKITRQSLSLYEKAERTINIELLGKIADVFNVSADYLLGFSDVQSVDTDIQTACKVTGLSENAINEIKRFCSFTTEDDIVDKLYTEEDAVFFSKHNISRTGIINTIVEQILPLICFTKVCAYFLQLFTTFKKWL